METTSSIPGKIEKIKEICISSNLPGYRESQLYGALFKNGISDFRQMTDIPMALRYRLQDELGTILSLHKAAVQNDKGTEKILFKTEDGFNIESVLMRYNSHSTLCLSSQSGCALMCKFCATGAMGFNKNLTADEICDQVLYFIQKNKRPDNIVAMGMGEPLLNEEFFTALKILTDEKYYGYGQRKISVSTVGIIPGIIRMTNEFPQVNLSFSLHSPFENERLSLMPITKTYPIDKVFEVLNKHIEKTNRRVFIAYLLIKGLNDTKEHALKLADLLKAQGPKAYLYHVNLIKYHESKTFGFVTPSTKEVEFFSQLLFKKSINNTIRQNFGEEIDAACGQLDAKVTKFTKK